MKLSGTISFRIGSGVTKQKRIIKKFMLAFFIEITEEFKNSLVCFGERRCPAKERIHVSVEIISIGFKSLITRTPEIVLVIVQTAPADPKSSSKLRLCHIGIFAKRF